MGRILESALVDQIQCLDEEQKFFSKLHTIICTVIRSQKWSSLDDAVILVPVNAICEYSNPRRCRRYTENPRFDGLICSFIGCLKEVICNKLCQIECPDSQQPDKAPDVMYVDFSR